MKNLKNALFIVLIVLITLSTARTQAQTASFKTYSIEEVIELSKKEPKKVLIDVYTDWCGWCKKMDQTTYQEEEIIRQLNEHYYFVKLNAEQKEQIFFKGKTYEFNESYKTNTFAATLLEGKLSYPSIIVMDEQMSVLTVVQGYLTAKDLGPILTYFGKNIHKKMKWDEFISK